MEKLYFERFEASQVTDDMLQEASQLFNGNYGVWHEDAEQHMGPFAKAGRPVRLSVGRLRADYLTASGTYARVTTRDGRLVGNTFACRWTYDGDKNVCWVTQLVVHRDFRQRGLASGLLNLLRNDDDDFCGILSSHPAACLAAFKAFGSTHIHPYTWNEILSRTMTKFHQIPSASQISKSFATTQQR